MKYKGDDETDFMSVHMFNLSIHIGPLSNISCLFSYYFASLFNTQLPVFLYFRLGRKPTSIWSMFIGGLSCGIIAAIPNNKSVPGKNK